MTRPAASVIVPTHQGAHRLDALLQQLAVQDVAAPWQLVVVVDGVLDSTPALLDDWSGRLPLTVLVNERAHGVGAALQRGFEAAQGEYLIRCDDDLDVTASFISSHLDAQAGRRDRVVLALTRDVFPSTPYAVAYGRPANERALADAYARAPEHRWQHLAACFSLHADALAAVGGFDARFAYGEDSEFGYRLWRSGCEFIIDPALEVGHRGPATSAATRVPRAFVAGASRRLFAQVHPEARRPDAAASGLRGRLWDAGVSAVASAARTPSAYRRLGHAADVALGVLPARLGGRLVALLVEAAARSGVRNGSDDLHSYRSQKDAEAHRERTARPA